METVELDLPALAGAFCRAAARRRRAGDAGAHRPTSPARCTSCGRSRRRRLYCTARVGARDRPRAGARRSTPVFADGVRRHRGRREPFAADECRRVAPPSDEPAGAGGAAAAAAGRRAAAAGVLAAAGSRPEASEDETRRVEVPLARGKRRGAALATRSFDALHARRARAALPADVAPAARDPDAAHPPLRARPPRPARIDMRRTLRRSLRTGGDPIRLARRHRRVVPRRLVMLCDISGSMEPYARAYLQFLTCAARQRAGRRGVRVRDPAHAASRARSRRARPAAGDRAGGGGGARLVERDADRRRAEGVQRPPRPPRDGPRGGRGDPVRRLGARRPRARRAARWSGSRGSPTGSCGSTRASSASGFAVRAGGMVAALPHCDALVSGHSFEALGEVVDAIGRRSRSCRRSRRRSRQTSPSRGRARRRSPEARWRCRAGTAHARAQRRRGG